MIEPTAELVGSIATRIAGLLLALFCVTVPVERELGASINRHCEGAKRLRQSRKRTKLSTTGLPRFARNDEVEVDKGTQLLWNCGK